MNTEDNKELKLLRSKVKYLEDRMKVMTMSIGSINNILGRFQMTENRESYARLAQLDDIDQGFKDIEQIKDHVSKVNIIDDHELI